MWDGAEPSQGAEIVSFPSPLTLDSVLGKLTMAGIWDGAEPSPADMFRGRLGGGGGCSTTTSRNIDALCFFFLFGPVAVKAEEWKTRFSILHFQVGCWCYGKTTKLQVDDIQLDWTASPISRDNGDDYEEEEYKGDDDAGVGGPDDDYVNDDGDDDDDQG